MQKEKALRFLAYALVISYQSDFFAHEIVYGGLNMDKLPFHISTALCPLGAMAQFLHDGHKLREPVAVMGSMASWAWVMAPMYAVACAIILLFFGLANRTKRANN